MDRIERDVRRELSRFGPVEGAIVEIVRAWPAAVGETVARSAWPARLARDGTLHVNTVSSTWAFELGRLGETILEQLRRDLGESTPPVLRFAPGPVPEPDAEGSADSPATTPEVAAEHRAEGALIAAAIEDEELRELVARAAAASLSRASAAPADDRRF
jgi:hypothetical protein